MPSLFDCMLVGAATAVAMEVVIAAYDKVKHRLWVKPREPWYEVRLFDDKGIPLRTHLVKAKEMAELIHNFEERWRR